MNKVSAISVAKQRLTEKKDEVQQQLEVTKDYLESSKLKNNTLSLELNKSRGQIHTQFLALHDALKVKEKELIDCLESQFQRVSTLNGEVIVTTEKLIDNSQKALEGVDSVYNEADKTQFFKGCSSVCQQLEESFLELLLHTNSQCDDDDCSPLDNHIDVTDTLHCIQKLTFGGTAHKDGETLQSLSTSSLNPVGEEVVCDSVLVNDTVPECSNPTQQVSPPTEALVTDQNASDETVHTRLIDLPCAEDGLKSTSVSVSECSETPSHLSLSIVENSYGVPVPSSKVEHAKLSVGQRLEVMITDVVDPSDICAQPYGTELVDLMEMLGGFYESLADQGDYGGLLVAPKVGDFCCAQFTQDDCWYRAMVVAVDQIYTTQGISAVPTPNVWVKVNYIDYGNQEQLPLSRLRVLDHSFCGLPCQALSCYLAGIEPTMHPLIHKSDSDAQLSAWSPQVNQWLIKLLLGKKVELVVLALDEKNRLDVDIVVPVDWVYSSESLANFPIPVQSIANLPQSIKQRSSIRLSLFMCNAGLAKTPSAHVEHHLFPFVQPFSTPYIALMNDSCSLPVYSVDAGICSFSNNSSHSALPIEDGPPEKDTENHSETSCDTDSTISPVQQALHIQNSTSTPPTIEDLQPLTVTVGTSSEFCLLVSHVVSPKEFYAHPIQEDVAAEIGSFSKSLSTYYASPSNRCHLSPEQIKTRVLCCVQFPGDDQWYRGVILSPIDIQENDSIKECSVQLVDFGETHMVSLENVYELAQEFSSSPTRAICCSAVGLDKLSEDGACNVTNDEYRSTNDSPVKSVSGKMTKVFQDLVANKQLVAFIADEEESEFSYKYGCVVSVDLLDTSGDTNIHINNRTLQLMSEDTPVNRQPELNAWNPMEHDYLAGRNNYKIDDEDTGLALHGYKSTNRPCRFYKSRDGCFRGEKCPYLHLQEGVSDMQSEEVYTHNDSNDVATPAVNTIVVVIVTAIVSATKFYVQMPLGNKSALQKSPTKQKTDVSEYNEDFIDLLKEMTAYYDRKVFSERCVIKAKIAEIVAVRYEVDDQWYRARVVDDSLAGKTKVFYVDYGNTVCVSDDNVRCIKPEFLSLPFQAVECYLPDLQYPQSATPADKQKTRKYFESLVTGQVLIAKVVTKRSELILGVELYSDIHINKKLLSEKHLSSTSTCGDSRERNTHVSPSMSAKPG